MYIYAMYICYNIYSTMPCGDGDLPFGGGHVHEGEELAEKKVRIESNSN